MTIPNERIRNDAKETVHLRYVAITSTLAVAAVCWVVAIRHMVGMNMGVASQLGSLRFFVVLWASMMAAMMLPGATPAVSRRAQATGQLSVVPLFVGSYLAVWTLVGVAVFALYRPHGATTAGIVVILVGVYELTPLKSHFRRRCSADVRSGFEFGFCCLGSSIGLMLVLVAVSIMSITWMSMIAVLSLAQKLLPVRALVDVPVALAIIGLGVLIIIDPALIPGLMPPM
jgi:predicted metal-binding membrane protein